jgi:hypothetical protein
MFIWALMLLLFAATSKALGKDIKQSTLSDIQTQLAHGESSKKRAIPCNICQSWII